MLIILQRFFINIKKEMKNISVLMIFALSSLSLSASAQYHEVHGFEEGCVNFMDYSYGSSVGDYADRNVSFIWSHEKVLDEHWLFGVGTGVSLRRDYRTTNLPLFCSGRYLFIDRQFSPFINLKAGTYFALSQRNNDTDVKYSTEKTDARIYISPSIGAKWQFSQWIGVSASVSDEMYLMKVYNNGNSQYSNRIIGNLTINMGLVFQINGF
jgi:hypothetical protein